MRVAVVIVTWNSADCLAQCLDAFRTQALPVDVIVVDNASADGTVDLVRRDYAFAQLVETGANLGFSGGVNFGLAMPVCRSADFVFLLNPDARVDANTIASAVSVMSGSALIAAVSPVILNDRDDSVWFAGSRIDWKNGHTPHVHELPHEGDSPRRTERFSGCAVLLRKSAIDEVGTLDDNYFLYYEETDWSVRFVRAGYELVVDPSARAWHAASTSTGGFDGGTYQYYMTRNRMYFLRKFGVPALRVLSGAAVLSLRELKHAYSRGGLTAVRRLEGIKRKAFVDWGLGRLGRRDLVA